MSNCFVSVGLRCSLSSTDWSKKFVDESDIVTWFTNVSVQLQPQHIEGIQISIVCCVSVIEKFPGGPFQR